MDAEVNAADGLRRTQPSRAEAQPNVAEARHKAVDLARALAQRGVALFMQDQRADAIACFRQAVELTPDDARLWEQLAKLHARDEVCEAALPGWQRSVALQPTSAKAHNDLGSMLIEMGRLGQAAEYLCRARDLQPEYVDAHVNLGRLHEITGEFAEAELCYRRARAANPAAAQPLARLATLLRDRLPDHDRQDLLAVLQSRNLTDEQRLELLFGLAQVLDARGAYTEAAGYVAQANHLAREQRHKQNCHYEPDQHSRYIDLLVEHFTQPMFHRLAGAGNDSRLPVFVFGLPRSGTTLVEQILASHPRVHGAGELRLAPRWVAAVPTIVGPTKDLAACLQALSPAAVHTLSQRYLNGLQAILHRDCPGRAVDRVVDKLPDNYQYLWLLALMFPRATLIHVRRDPRDVAVSCWLTNFSNLRWSNDLADIARYMHDYRRVMMHWQTVLPTRIHEVVYERLVDDFETEARRLVALCELEWDPACLQFHRTLRPVNTPSRAQVRQPVYRAAIGRWKNYEKLLGDLFARLPLQ